MARRDLVFLDFDGTLVDSMEQYTSIFSQILAADFGVPVELSRRKYEASQGMAPEAQLAAVLRLAGVEAEVVPEITRRFWLQAAAFMPPAYPEVPEVLRSLCSSGWRLILTTQTRQDLLQARLAHAGIGSFFDLALGVDPEDPERTKGPGHFRAAQESLGVSEDEFRARSVMVGDGAYDMAIAREAGIIAVGRLAGDNAEALRRAGAQHLIADLTELPPLLEALRR